MLDDAQRLHAAGNNKQAVRLLRATLLSGASSHDKARAYALLAQISIEGGDYRDAYLMVKRCLEVEPEHAEARAMLRDHHLEARAEQFGPAKYIAAVGKVALGTLLGYFGVAMLLSAIPSFSTGHPSPAVVYGMVCGLPVGLIGGIAWAYGAFKKARP